jgi:hypothetical protein
LLGWESHDSYVIWVGARCAVDRVTFRDGLADRCQALSPPQMAIAGQLTLGQPFVLFEVGLEPLACGLAEVCASQGVADSGLDET